MLDGEERAGPTEPGLDLVGDQDHAVLVAQLPQPLQERGRGGDEAALAQDRLDDDGGHVRRVDLGHHGPVQLADGVGHPLVLGERAGAAVEVGERQPVDLRGEGGEALLEQPELAGHGQGQVRPAVVRPLEHDHALAARGVAGDADRGLDRLGPRVAEQGALVEVPGGDRVEPFGDVEVGLRGGHDVADVDEVRGLVLYRLDDVGRRVTHGEDADPPRQVDEVVAVEVDDHRSAGGGDAERGQLGRPAGHGGFPTGHQFEALGPRDLGDQLDRFTHRVPLL